MSAGCHTGKNMILYHIGIICISYPFEACVYVTPLFPPLQLGLGEKKRGDQQITWQTTRTRRQHMGAQCRETLAWGALHQGDLPQGSVAPQDPQRRRPELQTP